MHPGLRPVTRGRHRRCVSDLRLDGGLDACAAAATGTLPGDPAPDRRTVGPAKESQPRAPEAELEAERARLEAQQAEQRAAEARQGALHTEATHEDRIRAADRLDPDSQFLDSDTARTDERDTDAEAAQRRTR